MIEGAVNHAIKLCIRSCVWRLSPFEKSRPVAYILHLKKGVALVVTAGQNSKIVHGLCLPTAGL